MSSTSCALLFITTVCLYLGAAGQRQAEAQDAGPLGDAGVPHPNTKDAQGSLKIESGLNVHLEVELENTNKVNGFRCHKEGDDSDNFSLSNVNGGVFESGGFPTTRCYASGCKAFYEGLLKEGVVECKPLSSKEPRYTVTLKPSEDEQRVRYDTIIVNSQVRVLWSDLLLNRLDSSILDPKCSPLPTKSESSLKCLARWDSHGLGTRALIVQVKGVGAEVSRAKVQVSFGTDESFSIDFHAKTCPLQVVGPLPGLMKGAARQRLRIQTSCGVEMPVASGDWLTLVPDTAGEQVLRARVRRLGAFREGARAIEAEIFDVPKGVKNPGFWQMKDAAGMQLGRLALPVLESPEVDHVDVRYGYSDLQSIAGGPARRAPRDGSTAPEAGAIGVVDPTKLRPGDVQSVSWSDALDPGFGVLNEVVLDLPTVTARYFESLKKPGRKNEDANSQDRDRSRWCVRASSSYMDLFAGFDDTSDARTTSRNWLRLSPRGSIGVRIRRRTRDPVYIDLKLVKDGAKQLDPAGGEQRSEAHAETPERDGQLDELKERLVLCRVQRRQGQKKAPHGCSSVELEELQQKIQELQRRNTRESPSDGGCTSERSETLVELRMPVLASARRASIPLDIAKYVVLRCGRSEDPFYAHHHQVIAPPTLHGCKLMYRPSDVRGLSQAKRKLFGHQIVEIAIKAKEQETPRKVKWIFSAAHQEETSALKFPVAGQDSEDFMVAARAATEADVYRRVRRTSEGTQKEDQGLRRFEARVRPRGPFGWCWFGGNCLPLRSYFTIALSPTGIRFPASGIDAESSAKTDVAQLTPLRAGLLFVLEPWDYTQRENPLSVPVRFPIGLMLQSAKVDTLPPSFVTGISFAQPLVAPDSQLGTSATLSLLFEHDFRQHGGNYLLMLFSLDVFSVLSPEQSQGE